MPSERSLYRKIQTVLDVAKSLDASRLGDLCQGVKDQSPDIFVTTRYVSDKDKFISAVSLKSIKRTVAFCRALELLTETGELTPQGRDASRRTHFSAALADQVRSLLARNGVKLSEMNSVIRAKLHAQTPVLPTAEVLWSELRPHVGQGVFSKLLTLLVYCDHGESSQRKVYLSFSGKG